MFNKGIVDCIRKFNHGEWLVWKAQVENGQSTARYQPLQHGPLLFIKEKAVKTCLNTRPFYMIPWFLLTFSSNQPIWVLSNGLEVFRYSWKEQVINPGPFYYFVHCNTFPSCLCAKVETANALGLMKSK